MARVGHRVDTRTPAIDERLRRLRVFLDADAERGRGRRAASSHGARHRVDARIHERLERLRVFFDEGPAPRRPASHHRLGARPETSTAFERMPPSSSIALAIHVSCTSSRLMMYW